MNPDCKVCLQNDKKNNKKIIDIIIMIVAIYFILY